MTTERGMWKDYDIDAKQLHRDAWGTDNKSCPSSNEK